MFTRNQYMNGECTHSDYYGQFVTDPIKKLVKTKFGLAYLKNEYAKDQNFNTIALSSWDVLYYWINSPATKELLLSRGDFMSLAGSVCIAKEAARQLVTENEPVNNT